MDLLILEKALNTVKVIVTMSIFINFLVLFVILTNGNKDVSKM